MSVQFPLTDTSGCGNVLALQVNNQILGPEPLQFGAGQGPLVENDASGAEGPFPCPLQAIQAEESSAKRLEGRAKVNGGGWVF